MPASPSTRRLAAVLFSDVKGFSRQMDTDEDGTLLRLREHNGIFDAAIGRHSGHKVKTIGDAYMVKFTSSISAVRCALDVQLALGERNRGKHESQRIEVRIGIHIGDVVAGDVVMADAEDVLGGTVNIASRLEKEAPAGGICVSEAVYQQVRRKVHASAVEIGTPTLKGITEAPRAFILRPSRGLLDHAPLAFSLSIRRKLFRPSWPLVGILILILGPVVTLSMIRFYPRASTAACPEGMVAVPAGQFFMGCDDRLDKSCDEDERPGRIVRLTRDFCIDRTEVTVAAYSACVEAGTCRKPGTGDMCNGDQTGRDAHPVNCVSWYDAVAYCAWHGEREGYEMRLPSEAEWEKAARGENAGTYPWGEDKPGMFAQGNFADESMKRSFSWSTIAGYDDGYATTAPAGAFPDGQSPYGVLDMEGNLSEWVSDRYEAGYYGTWNTPVEDPSGPQDGWLRVVRGGSFATSGPGLRVTDRTGGVPTGRNSAIGFRCAWNR